MSQTWDKPGGDRIRSICDDRDLTGRRFESRCQRATKRDYHFGARARHFASQCHMALQSSFGAVAFYHNVLALNEAEPFQLLEQSAVNPSPSQPSCC